MITIEVRFKGTRKAYVVRRTSSLPSARKKPCWSSGTGLYFGRSPLCATWTPKSGAGTVPGLAVGEAAPADATPAKAVPPSSPLATDLSFSRLDTVP